MRILVTGASGLVGGAIATHLSDHGHEVLGLSRHLSPNSGRFAVALAVELGTPGAVASLGSVARCDAIIHAAAALSPELSAVQTSQTNCVGTQQLLGLAHQWDVDRFVFISGVTVIGRPADLPVTEEHPTAPRNAYLASKLYGEQLASLAREQGMAATILRLSAPIGAQMPDGRILSEFIRRALSDQPLELAGTGRRGQDYVDVRDVAGGVVGVLAHGGPERLNIASGRCVTNLELAQTCTSVLGSASQITFSSRADPEDDVRWEISIQRAQRTVGFTVRYTLADSILDFATAIQRGARDDAQPADRAP